LPLLLVLVLVLLVPPLLPLVEDPSSSVSLTGVVNSAV
jgi:hypothetical protein